MQILGDLKISNLSAKTDFSRQSKCRKNSSFFVSGILFSLDVAIQTRLKKNVCC